MKKIVFYIIYLLSRSPIFSITLDRAFHNIDNKNYEFEELRFSLLSLGLGIYKVYFATYKKGEGCKVCKVLRLNDVAKLPSKTEISEMVKVYSEHIATKEPEEIEIEIDFLKYKIADKESTKSTATNKINNYTAIILVFIPLICANGLKFVLELKSKLFIILAIMIIYSLVNIIIYILNFYKVNSFLRSSFIDLMNSPKHQNKLAESYYEDWYPIKKEAPIFVNYVVNVERYLKITIVFMVLFLLIYNINAVNPRNTISETANTSVLNYSVDIECSQTGKIPPLDLNKLIEIQNKLLNAKINQIVILKPETSNELIKRKYQFIIDMVETYNVKKVDLIEVVQEKANSITNENGSIKILIIGGK